MEYGTPTLAAERGTGVEGVPRIRNRRWNGQFVAYRNQIDDYVYLLAAPDTLVGGRPVSVFRYVQDDATLQGLKASMQLPLPLAGAPRRASPGEPGASETKPPLIWGFFLGVPVPERFRG